MFRTKGKRVLGLALLWIGFVGQVQALGGELYIYPNKGQSAEQQARDRYDCHTWAVQQTGVDPTRAQASTPTPPPPQGASSREPPVGRLSVPSAVPSLAMRAKGQPSEQPPAA